MLFGLQSGFWSHLAHTRLCSQPDGNGNGSDANGATHQEMALRHWAKHEGYNPEAIFNRVWHLPTLASVIAILHFSFCDSF